MISTSSKTPTIRARIWSSKSRRRFRHGPVRGQHFARWLLRDRESSSWCSNGNVNATGRDTDNKITGNERQQQSVRRQWQRHADRRWHGGDNFADTLNGGAGNDTYFVEGHNRHRHRIPGASIRSSPNKSRDPRRRASRYGKLTGTGNMDSSEHPATIPNSTAARQRHAQWIGRRRHHDRRHGDDTYFVDNHPAIWSWNSPARATTRSTARSAIRSATMSRIWNCSARRNISGTGND